MIYLTLVGGGFLFLNGCATVDYHLGATSSYSRTIQKDGLEITIDPLVDRERSKHYFGINAASQGIAIFFVHVANRSQNRTFIVEKKGFRLGLPAALEGRFLGNSDVKRDANREEAAAWASMAVSLGAFLAGGVMINASMEIQRNFVAKEMPDQTLPA